MDSLLFHNKKQRGKRENLCHLTQITYSNA